VQLDPLRTLNNWQPYHPSLPYVYNQSGQLSYRLSGLDERVASIESKICLPTQDATMSTSRSSPPDPSSSWAASISTAASSPRSIGAPDTDTILCERCGVEFTGVYRSGNLARHVRHKHAEAKEGQYICIAKGCDRVFARQDARLKHARKRHPGLHDEPVHRKQGYKTSSHTADSSARPNLHEAPVPLHESTVRPLSLRLVTASAVDSDETMQGGYGTVATYHGFTTTPYSNLAVRTTTNTMPGSSTCDRGSVSCTGQWVPTSSHTFVYGESVVDDPYTNLEHTNSSLSVEELPRAARVVFASLYAKLDDKTYERLRDTTIARLESLVQYLREQQ
jgi:hypothetical protein